MNEQLQALKNKIKSIGSKIGNKIDEATMGEHELRVKHGVEKSESNETKLKKAQEATTMSSNGAEASPSTDSSVQMYNAPVPAVMKVGRRIIK